MCECINVSFGSYGNQVEIKDLPPHMAAYKKMDGGARSICLDRCVAEEVQHLWSLGITTTGCCCGHNIDGAFIGVIDEDIPKMKEMGYEVWFNRCRPGDEDSFVPKSIQTPKRLTQNKTTPKEIVHPICNKRPFVTEEEAKRDLRRIQKKGLKRHKTPVRAYECPKCSYWHLTSIPRRLFRGN